MQANVKTNRKYIFHLKFYSRREISNEKCIFKYIIGTLECTNSYSIIFETKLMNCLTIFSDSRIVIKYFFFYIH